MNVRAGKSGFTLIELLVVIAIIGLIAGMLMGAMGAVRRGAKKTKAKSEISQIKAAWNGYLSEYHHFNVLGNTGGDITKHDLNKDALDVLCGYNKKANPQEIAFLDFTNDKDAFRGRKMEFVDPWGKMYRFSLDGSGDNRVTGNTGQEVLDVVAVWSLGPDMKEGTVDDIVSWKK